MGGHHRERAALRPGGAAGALNTRGLRSTATYRGAMPTTDDWRTHGFVRVAAVTAEVTVADLEANRRSLESAVRSAAALGATIVVTPELGLTGYSAGDLFAQQLLLAGAWSALQQLAENLADLGHVTAVVGLPVRATDSRVYNAAAVVSGGAIWGVVPKQYLPNRAEFYEDRWFTRALGRTLPASIDGIAFGTDLLFDLGVEGAVLGIELCEDLWSASPPSGALALAGATIIANPSASPEVLGKSTYRRELVRMQSARCLAAYLYAGSGPGESTMDVVFAGHSLVAENGVVLGETKRFEFGEHIVTADIDLEQLLHERATNSSFAGGDPGPHRVVQIPFRPAPMPLTGLQRPIDPRPFVPSDASRRRANCEEIFAIQATGLAKRLRHTGSKRAVIGISGGLDSTLAVLVACRALDTLAIDRSGIVAITMPGLGTTDRTYQNALGLMAALGTTPREIPIGDAVLAHFDDIGHDADTHDVVYENSQARERTQILMDVANQVGGMVIGTGDLSEAALGWMTFNGDHMSMYHVNAGVPKTLVRYLVQWAAEELFEGETRRILHDIVDTPITPELLPLQDGRLAQKTEEVVGPYDLHDFFLFHIVRYGSRPAKVFALAEIAFRDKYDGPTILTWLEVFVRRFFSQQFKRSSMPDGPKVGSVALSPRGDWRMPSDASSASWLAEVQSLRA